jgi:hypothetical protein
MVRVLFSLILLGGCTCAEPQPGGEPAPLAAVVKSPPASSEPALAWADALSAVDQRLAVHADRDDATHQGLAAQLLLSRARLTGSYDDYARAEDHVNRAFAASAAGGGSYLTRASLNYSLHRLDRVEADLDAAAGAVLVDKPTQAAIALARGKLRLHQGRYAEARTLVQTAIDLRPVPQPTALATLGLIYWRTGAFDDADALYADALEGVSRKPSEARAWLHLQRGLLDLDRGRYDDALVHYEAAGAVLSGWYLVDEHIAEVYVLTGRSKEARPIYARVAEETKSPEFYDALAALDASNEDASQAWVALAREAYEAQLKRFPEAAYGHALGHYQEFGPPERALELAEANVKVRPYGAAATSLIEARLAAGKAQDAADLADATLRTTWKSADLHAAAADAFDAVQRADDAAAQRDLAKAINPHVFD